MTILIADDSAFMRTILKDILHTSDWKDSKIVEAGDGEEALALYEKEQPDLVLLDIVMPKKDGMAVLKEIGGKATIIVISAVGQEKLIEEAKGLGAKGFINKPFAPANVTETITGVVGSAA